jgi:hypothetical protein
MMPKGLLHVLMIAVALILFGAAGAMAEETTSEVCEWVGESAWADGDLYVKKGNWATYVDYEALFEDSDSGPQVTLYAGRALEAGTVHFSEVEEGFVTITIILADGWFFEAGEENVKIQDYDTEPEDKPSPGRFMHKFEASHDDTTLIISVPENNFYGVHVNVGEMLCQAIGPEDPDEPGESETPV